MENGRKAGILVVDDEEGIRHGISRLFEREGFRVHAAGTAGAAVEVLKKTPIDAAIVDIRLREDSNGIELLREFKKIEPDLAVIMITGYGSIDGAVDSMKAGASEYLLKPVDNEKLLQSVRRFLELKDLRLENDYLRSELYSNFCPYELVTANAHLRALVATADKIKNTDATILLSGESGTGKEMMARYIHFTGNRRDRRFVGINCAALSETLLLSELFGHEKGAFTGAIERKAGKFELADGGTLFLDEIGDMSLDAQAKLLRVLEENSFERVGGTRKVVVDVRLIAATNRDLRKLIAAGSFREDLYYRIHVISLELPPLRERRDDIPLLIEHFIGKYNERYNKKVAGFRDPALERLLAYDWPGNIRELQNVVNQAVLLGEAPYVDPPGFSAQGFSLPGSCPAPISPAEPPSDSRVRPLKEALADVSSACEKRLVQSALRETGGNKSRTARLLGVTRKTLARKIEKYGLE